MRPIAITKYHRDVVFASTMGILQRDGKVRTVVVPNRKKEALQDEVTKHVETGSALYTDALLSYNGLANTYAHQVIDHAVAYVDENVHTNGLENYWSLLKRGLAGTYVSVEPFHLFRYLDEQAFRFNNRKDATDYDRFRLALSQIVGKRLTWRRRTLRRPDRRRPDEIWMADTTQWSEDSLTFRLVRHQPQE